MWVVETPEQEKLLRHTIYTMVRPLALRVRFDRVENDIDDIVQIVQMTVFRYANQFRGETQAEYQAWLRQVVYLTVLQLRRKSRFKKRRAVMVEFAPDTHDGPEDHQRSQPPIDRMILTEELDHLSRAMKHLVPADRELIEMHIYEGLSFQSMADKLCKSPSGIRYSYDKACLRLISEFNKNAV
jgi:RNA polymerase sigma factor (sigma-70 family)